jgi:hypothetical protein
LKERAREEMSRRKRGDSTALFFSIVLLNARRRNGAGRSRPGLVLCWFGIVIANNLHDVEFRITFTLFAMVICCWAGHWMSRASASSTRRAYGAAGTLAIALTRLPRYSYFGSPRSVTSLKSAELLPGEHSPFRSVATKESSMSWRSISPTNYRLQE